jgi:hypothetical protein
MQTPPAHPLRLAISKTAAKSQQASYATAKTTYLPHQLLELALPCLWPLELLLPLLLNVCLLAVLLAANADVLACKAGSVTQHCRQERVSFQGV